MSDTNTETPQTAEEKAGADRLEAIAKAEADLENVQPGEPVPLPDDEDADEKRADALAFGLDERKAQNATGALDPDAEALIAENAENDDQTDREIAASQHPSLSGAREVEIAKRGADIHTETSEVYIKDFLIGGGVKFDKSWNHVPNFGHTRQEMISKGLRPLEDVRFVKHIKVDASSFVLRYECKVIPTAIALNEDVVTIPQP